VVLAAALVAWAASLSPPSPRPGLRLDVVGKPRPLGNETYRARLGLSWTDVPTMAGCSVLVLASERGDRANAWRASPPQGEGGPLRAGNIWLDVTGASNGTAEVEADLAIGRPEGGAVVEAVLLCRGEARARDEAIV
jgi:hypothetical protein